MSLTVKIVNNEAGKVIVDRNDCMAIVGGLGFEDHARGLGVGSGCSPIVLYGTVEAAQATLAKTVKDHPEIDLLTRLFSCAEDMSKVGDMLKEIEKEMESYRDVD